ncbi:hypothetical protein A9918_13475 [Acinetobacter baumannii]|nr:hypothetical protein A9918_13475 [Acinetobacter baumannii]OBL72068.1 hypothetical protein A9877_16425 [Acinetobacter baumannii]OBM04225.1 hypothetical protein A9930_12435 [Acinetobacter baumannii]OBN95265.1 hypothetical protein A9902_14810 [Acinetobacter baumannii]OBN95271.1 hypothetical protein A9903_16110 [Acinetobacter baumannii]
MNKYFAFTILTLFSSGAWASQSEPRNWTAIIMFACVVGISLLITFKGLCCTNLSLKAYSTI